MLDTFVFHCIYYNTTNSELSNKTVILCSDKNRIYYSKSFTFTFTINRFPILSFSSTVGRPTMPSISAVHMVDFGCVFTKATASESVPVRTIGTTSIPNARAISSTDSLFSHTLPTNTSNKMKETSSLYASPF